MASSLTVKELFPDYTTDSNPLTLPPLSLFLSPHQTVSSSGPGRSESPVYTNLQELKITQNNLPPYPSGSPIHVLGDWETFKDQNGRHFYYNRSTQERTWKPPRAKDASSGSSRGDNHSAGESSEVRTEYIQLHEELPVTTQVSQIKD